MSSAKNSWSSAIQMWYDEVKNFKYGVGSSNGGVVGHYTQVQPVPNSAALESLQLLRETDCRRPLAKVSMNWAPGHFTTQSAGCLVQVVPSRLCYGPLSQCCLPVLLRLPVLPTVSVAHTPTYLDIDRIRCFASWFFFFFLVTLCFANHCRGNYQLQKPYTSGNTCGDCPKACSNKLCSKWRRFISQLCWRWIILSWLTGSQIINIRTVFGGAWCSISIAVFFN